MSLMEKFGFTSQFDSKFLKSTALLADYSGWYHVTVNIDTHNPQNLTEQIFINVTQLTSFISNNYPSQNYDLSGLG